MFRSKKVEKSYEVIQGVGEEEINQLYNQLLGTDCEENLLKKIVKNRYSLERIKNHVLNSNQYREKKNTIFNFEKWVEFGIRYTYLLKDKTFIQPPSICNNNLVLIDFRYLENMEFVIRNALLRLDGKFMVTFVCGLSNYDEIKILCSEISKNINVLKLEEHINSQDDYNNLLLKSNFWEKLEGENILIHQFDAFIFKEWNPEFFESNYLGSPCYFSEKELIITGGFSFRKKEKMISLLKEHNPSNIFEDMFFTRSLDVDKELCENFAFQEKEFDAFGGHQFWKAKNYSFGEMYDKLVREKSDIYKYPNLFHKFVLGLKSPRDPIKYEIKQSNFDQKDLVAHLHCYDIEQFNDFYGYKIEEIVKYYFTIVTYSKGIYLGNINNVVVLKHENKGSDLGAKFVCNKYLEDINYEYNNILCLHSKKNREKRKNYFDPFLSNIEKIVLNIDKDVGCYTIPLPLINRKILSSINYDDKWDHNKEYMLEIARYMNLPNYGKVFPEGNVYLLSKNVYNKMYGDVVLFNCLNTFDSFDYLWVKTYYKLEGDIKFIYDKWKKDSLFSNNYSTNLGWEGLADCMIEHIFERIVFGVVKKLNLSIKLLNNNLPYNSFQLTNFIYTQRLNCLNNKPITIMACHTSNHYKYNAIVNNISYFFKISDEIYIVNSTEFKGEIEKIIDNELYIINDNLTRKQINSYRNLNIDLENLTNNQCSSHWRNHGKNENRKIGHKRLYINYNDNDNLLCQGKWYKTVKNISLNNSYILTNDSFFIVNNIGLFFKETIKNYEMVSISQSNEIKYHYTDFLRYYNDIGIKKILKFYEENFHKCEKFSDVIENLEIESTYVFQNKKAIYKVEDNYLKNIHFDDEMNQDFLEKGYPIIKIKKLTSNQCKYKNFPNDFDPIKYKKLHPDLIKMSDIEANLHFITYGFKEGRQYKKNQENIIPEYLRKYEKIF